jgi:hypothetical protein
VAAPPTDSEQTASVAAVGVKQEHLRGHILAVVHDQALGELQRAHAAHPWWRTHPAFSAFKFWLVAERFGFGPSIIATWTAPKIISRMEFFGPRAKGSKRTTEGGR